ncbi:MAG: SPOR domain-containing protein [Syntrophothermus sp.]
MKRIISISAVCCLALAVEACGPSKQASEEVSTTEKEVFTVEEVHADTSAPLPSDSVWTADNSPEIKRGENAGLSTRKKSVDTQEAPSAAENKKTVINEVSAQPKAAAVEKSTEVKKEKSSGKTERFYVQLGAFLSEENAKDFQHQAGIKLKKELQLKYNEKISRYLVQYPGCDTKGEALNVVKELKKKGFSDVFIVQQAE